MLQALLVIYRVYTKEVNNFVHHFNKNYVFDFAAVGINGLETPQVFSIQLIDVKYTNNQAKLLLLIKNGQQSYRNKSFCVLEFERLDLLPMFNVVFRNVSIKTLQHGNQSSIGIGILIPPELTAPLDWLCCQFSTLSLASIKTRLDAM